MHWLGCIAINVRTEYSSALLRKRNPRRRWSGRVGRCHSTQCRGLGTRPATRNHPRTYNTHATGNHPSSLIVGRARLPSGLTDPSVRVQGRENPLLEGGKPSGKTPRTGGKPPCCVWRSSLQPRLVCAEKSCVYEHNRKEHQCKGATLWVMERGHKLVRVCTPSSTSVSHGCHLTT